MSGGEKVHLFDLRERTSAAGNRYLSGWLGRASVVAFLDREADGEVWNVFLSTPAPKPSTDGAQRDGSRSPFTPRQRQARKPARALGPGELNDDLSDL